MCWIGCAVSARVLVREDVGEPGLTLLREHFDVETGFDWSAEELAERIGVYDAILIRSATKLTAELIERGERLRIIARAESASTTSTSRRRPVAGSSSRTRRSRTSSPPPSTRSRCCSRSRATCRRRTPR